MNDKEAAQLVGDVAVFMMILMVIAIVTSMIGLIRRCWLMWPEWRRVHLEGGLPSPTPAELEGVTLVLMPLPAVIKARAERHSTAESNEVKTTPLSPEENKATEPDESDYDCDNEQLRLYIKAELEEKLRRDLENNRALFNNSLYEYDGLYTRDA